MIYLLPTDTCYGMACEIADSDAYNKIYEIKKRDFNKPLSILILDVAWLTENTNLTFDQLLFLQNYPRPFTILTHSRIMNHLIHYKDEYIDFHNNEIYEKIGFRIAHNEITEKLVNELGPMFLTSANISTHPEIYDEDELKKQFGTYLANKEMVYISDGKSQKLPLQPPSDVFEFIEKTTEVKYVRKN